MPASPLPPSDWDRFSSFPIPKRIWGIALCSAYRNKVLKESIKIYCAINDGIINLVDKFFEMSKHDAIEALDIYQRTGEQTQNLSDFYEFCKTLALARVFQFPTLKQPPEAFLVTMDDYIREAPAVGQVSSKKLEYVARKEGENEKLSEEDESSSPADVEEQESKHGPQDSVMGDLLSFDEVNPIDANLEENNALALAILPPGEDPKSSANLDFLGGDSSGWESTLDANSSGLSPPDSSKLGGELSKDLLNSLYENSDRMRQISEASGGGVSANPFDSVDPFVMPGNIAPPANVDTPFMAQLQQQQLYYQQLQQYYQQQQQQQQYYQHQQMMMVPYQVQNPQPQVSTGNPFADIGSSQDAPQQGNSGLH